MKKMPKKTAEEYDEVFEDLMYYKVINVDKVNNMDDIRIQIKFDPHISSMNNNKVFLNEMLNTRTAQAIVMGKFTNYEIKDAFRKALRDLVRKKFDKKKTEEIDYRNRSSK